MRFNNVLPMSSGQGAVAPTSTSLQSSSPLITTPPQEPDFELLRRQNKDTHLCGYIDGIIGMYSELRCSPQYECAAWTNGLVPAFGCCNDLACNNGLMMTCIDKVENFCESVPGACDMVATNILTCPTACVTYLMAPTGAADFNTFHSWSCGETRSTIMVLQTISGDLPPDSGGVSEPQTSTKREIVRVTSSTDTLQQVSGSNPTNTPGGSSPSGGQSTPSSSTGSILRIGLIVGSVVGILVLLGGTIWAIVWGIRRSKRKKAEREREAARQKRFETFNPGGQSEAFLMSDAGMSTAHWIHNNEGDRMSVRG